MTNVLLSLNELKRVDSIGHFALSLWNPAWKDKKLRFLILNNIALSHFYQSDTAVATSLFRQVYNEARNEHDVTEMQGSLMNLGSLKGAIGDLDSAYYFFNHASELAKNNHNLDDYLVLEINLATLDQKFGRYKQAHEKLDAALIIADSIKRLERIAEIHKARSDIFAQTGDYKKAFEELQKYMEINNQVLNEDRIKAVNDMMEKYESEKKARQIQKLEVENLDAALKNERVTKTRNKYIYIGSGILIVALGLWWRLNYVHKSRAAIRHEKEISEGLLLNILPASVAEELKIKGHADAQQFPMATILFSDFKSFTTISGNMSAEDLVKELNVCFKEFDDIMTLHGLEKIKTIGDAYMAAAAVPATNAATALEVVLAGLEMQKFIKARKQDRDHQNLEAFEMRVGIHSGPVVAGIVGVKKFQYDVWGDTVNIANRMETNCEVGQVNISETTYQLLQDKSNLRFTPRGMIHAKGKGEMPMYYVESAA
jgi:class 3 adenylate cyclase